MGETALCYCWMFARECGDLEWILVVGKLMIEFRLIMIFVWVSFVMASASLWREEDRIPIHGSPPKGIHYSTGKTWSCALWL